MDGGLRYFGRSGRFGFGLSDTVINQNRVRQFGTTFLRTRAEGLRYSATLIPIRKTRERFEISAGVVPYLHFVSYYSTQIPMPGYANCRTCGSPPLVPYTFVAKRPASLVDVSLKWVIVRGPYDFSYGARYMHQTITLGSWLSSPGASGPYSNLQHDTSLMPFIGVTARLGH